MPDDPELPDSIKRGLEAMRGDSTVAAGDPLEEAIVARLHAQGLLRQPATAPGVRVRSPLLLSLAAMLLLSVGVSLGRASVPVAPPQATHVLLLRGVARVGTKPVDDSTAREIYTRWARTEPSVVGGEELTGTGARIAQDTLASGATRAVEDNSSAEVVGYFLLRVASRAEAIRVARECPHLRFGGTVEVREIVAP